MAMGAGRGMTIPLLILNMLMYLVVLGIAGWAFNRILDGTAPVGNAATTTFVILSLIAGVVGISSLLVGLLHLRSWRTKSLVASGSSVLIAWLFTLLAFGLACKEIHTGARDRRLKALESFVIILAGTLLLYLLLPHDGLMNQQVWSWLQRLLMPLHCTRMIMFGNSWWHCISNKWQKRSLLYCSCG